MSTMADVAKRAGVVKSTVSNVLSGKKKVSKELSDKIMRACEELNFEPNFYATSLATGGSNIIGLFLEEQKEKFFDFYLELMRTVIVETSARGYHVLVYYGLDSEKLISTLQPGRAPIAGAIVLSPSLFDARIESLRKKRLPCVVIGHPAIEVERLPVVDVDNVGLAYQMTKRILARGKHTKVALLNSNGQLTISEDRACGWQRALTEFGAEGIVRYTGMTREDGRRLAEELLSSGAADAFVCCDAYVARGVYDAAEAIGLTIGRDLTVVALGNDDSDPAFSARLAYAHQNYGQIGKACVRKLLKVMNGDRDEEEMQTIIPCELHHMNFVDD